MSSTGDEHRPEAEKYWNEFKERANENVNSYLTSGPFEQSSFDRYLKKLTKRHGVNISESEMESTRGVLVENIKRSVKQRLDAMKDDMQFIDRFAELRVLKEEDGSAVRNFQNATMDMEFYNIGQLERYLSTVEDIFEMHDDTNKCDEAQLISKMTEMSTLRDAINAEIERKRTEKRIVHSEGNARRHGAQLDEISARRRRRSSLASSLNTTNRQI
ncbi:hypothetical protein PFISCL1PPCAC_20381 [Pristionchus fissidentatus]|uniref:Uncharacterized protein n=1 Tax=Pristionchus fissidentatus TaxID=1538716 RepID=A0AAV5WEE1_9BILA|nr:hypothetical protein PFISCL1PPCAC_20381 [Pristionchus fissidentatus]